MNLCPRGYTHVKTYGYAAKMVQFFAKNIPKHGSHLKKFQTMGLIFKIFEPRKILKILCVFVAKSQEMVPFLRKNPELVPIFGKRITPEHEYGS